MGLARSSLRWSVVHAVLLGVVLYVAAVLPLATARHTPRAEAQVQGLAAYVGQLCATSSVVGPEVCVFVVVAGLAVAIHEGYVPRDLQSLKDLAVRFRDWLASDFTSPSAVEEFKNQYALHPDHIDIDPVLQSWWQYAMGGAAQQWENTTYSGQAGVTLHDVAGGLAGQLQMQSLPSGATSSTQSTTVRVQWLASGPAEGGRVRLRVWDAAKQHLYTDQTIVMNPGSNASQLSSGYVLGQSTDFYGRVMYVQFDVLGPQAGLTHWRAGLAFVQFVQVWSGQAQAINWPYPYLATPVDASAVVLALPDGSVVHMPTSADSLVGSTGTTVVPREDGTTGAVVTPGNPGAEGAKRTDNPSFWERLFGGVTDAIDFGSSILGDIATGITDIYNVLTTTIETTLTGIREGVLAIPAAIATVVTAVTDLPNAIAALFDPAIAWADFADGDWPGIQLAWSGAMPGCLTDGLASQGSLFTGGGSPVVSIPTASMGAGPDHVNIDLSAASVYTYAASTVVCAVFGFVWALSRIKIILGGNEGLGGGDGE